MDISQFKDILIISIIIWKVYCLLLDMIINIINKNTAPKTRTLCDIDNNKL